MTTAAVVLEEFIPVYAPDVSGNERSYLNACVDSGWLSSNGAFVSRFEEAFAGYTGAPHATTVANGTVALHLALAAVGVGPGDEVLVPAFTYIASVNAIRMAGATPVFTEVRAEDWLMDPNDLEHRITPQTRAIMPVHLYSGICDMAPIVKLAQHHGLKVVEDAAEAFGTRCGGKHAGTAGDVGTFSFFGNKTITTGEGGMLVCRDREVHELACRLKSQGVKAAPERLEERYWHDLYAFNYRMNNMTAAVGLAQIERADATIARKREIANTYRAALSDLPVTFQELTEDTTSAHWLNTFLLPHGTDREALMSQLENEYRIQSRPTFFCAHRMPVFHDPDVSFPVCEDVAARGISIPSYPTLSDHDVDRVVAAVRSVVGALN